MGGITAPEAEARRRGVLVSATSVALILISIPLIARLARTDADTGPTITILVVGCALMALNPLLIRLPNADRAVGVLVCLEFVVALALLSHENGGSKAASLLWSLPTPFLAVILVTPVFGLICAGLVIGQIVGFYLAEANGYVFPQPLPDSEMTWWHMAGMTTVVCFIAFVAWLFENQRQRATGRILAYREQLDTVLERVPMVLFRADLDGVLHLLEGRASDVLGRPVDELVGKSLADLGPDLAAFAAPALRAREEPTSEVITVAGRTLEVRCAPLTGPDGAVTGVGGLAVDVSESVGKTQRLLLLERAIETTRAGITIKDTRSRIVYVNAAEAALHGYSSPAELLGEPANIFGLPEAKRRQTVTDLNAIGNWARESVNIRKDGSTFPVHLISDVVRNEAGVPIGVVTTCEDITERKRAATELREAHDKLRATSSQLIQNEKLTALGELAASVAHDLNQPLNTIKIISQSMLRDSAKGRYQLEDLPEDAREIVEVVNKMATVVDHLRVYARRPDEKSMVEVNLNTSIVSALSMLEGQLSVMGVKLQVDLDDGLPTLMGDPNSLEQVFLNLATNARDALQARKQADAAFEAAIWIGSHHDENDRVVVEVRDNAGGIPEEIRERIFDPFFTTKAAGAGTGLGLSIVQRIVSGHGGRIELEVEAGTGSTFRVIFPAADQALED